MTGRRIVCCAVAALAALLVCCTAAVYVPYQREQTALEEFELHGVAIGRGGILLLVVPDFGTITVERGGPEWLRNWIGDDGMRPFDRVTSVVLNDPSPFPPYYLRWESRYVPMDSTLKERVFPLLMRLRSIDHLTVSEGLLTEAELAELERRFPGMHMTVRTASHFGLGAPESVPPPR